MSTVAEQGRQRTAPRGTFFALVSHAIRMQLKDIIIWGAALGLYSTAMVALFTAIEGSAAQLNRLMEAYPKGMLGAFRITDLGNPANYLHSQFFGLAPLALSFFPILALANAIAGAEERGTIDVLLGNPLPRWQIVVGNFLATALSLLGICAIVGLLIWGTATLADVNLSLREVTDGALNLWPITLMFGTLALLCSALFYRRVLAVSIPAFLLFGMYLIDVIGRASKDLKDWRPASAFYYYGSAIEHGIDWTHFGGMILIALAFVLLAALAFRRRDIYT
jgi:ABC-2 type transport system permease protein